MTILITGGAGFIGSHMAGFLITKKIDFVVIDNFSNSNHSNLFVLEKFFNYKVIFYDVDIRDTVKLEKLFSKYKFKSIIHFAALKSVDESILNPQNYFDNNVNGTKNLLSLCKKYFIKNFIFSSSACVYGDPQNLPINENHRLAPKSPYGETKLICEELFFEDEFFSNHCNTIILRYFNPIGSFTNNIIGESLINDPKNIMPNIISAALGLTKIFKIYGDDYPTIDGSAIRDFIHIMDLVSAHYIFLNNVKKGIEIYNVGNGEGYSVKEIISTFENVNKVKIPTRIFARREGDIAISYSDNKKIIKNTSWKPNKSIIEMCRDSYLYAQKTYE